MRNSWISLHWSLNLVLSLSNHPRSRTILLGNSTYSFCTIAGAIDILSVYSVVSKVSFLVIFNNPSCSDNIFILYSQYWSILLYVDYATSSLCLSDGFKTINVFQWPNHYILFFSKISLVTLYQMLWSLTWLKLQLR